MLGTGLGLELGTKDRFNEGSEAGSNDGITLGASEGDTDGFDDGSMLGIKDGMAVGSKLGARLGLELPMTVSRLVLVKETMMASMMVQCLASKMVWYYGLSLMQNLVSGFIHFVQGCWLSMH